jgi:hypothetical protein
MQEMDKFDRITEHIPAEETMSAITVVFIESFQECSHAVIPKLDRAIVKRGKDPGAFWMESDALHTIALGLELKRNIKLRKGWVDGFPILSRFSEWDCIPCSSIEDKGIEGRVDSTFVSICIAGEFVRMEGGG